MPIEKNIDLRLGKQLRFDAIYNKRLLYRSIVSIYTKALFVRRKAKSTSWDGQNLYSFAFRGENEILQLHKELVHHKFQFSPAKSVRIKKNDKERTVYIWPWRERVVDLMLYQMLNSRLDFRMSKNVFAFRWHGYGIDPCQKRIEKYIATHADALLFFLKRDVSNCFPSISHKVLDEILTELSPQDDYLHHLLKQHIAFSFFDQAGNVQTAKQGVPFGAPTACLLANLSLLPFDDAIARLENSLYSRYADDMLFITPDPAIAANAKSVFDDVFARLELVSKETACVNGVLATSDAGIPEGFAPIPGIKHLGIYFSSGGKTSLAVDKQRKICYLFKRRFNQLARALKKQAAPLARARLLCKAARQILEKQQSPIAIIDYYLKHINDIKQLHLLDRWQAEEVLSRTFNNGHKKGNFKKIAFATLRELGLPSLLHRRRLLVHSHLDTSFINWKNPFSE
ncbi:MAG: hypothetical protein K5787_07140 [Lentisphaeria bacterium]|nr:hypothetical protein [Lentisphaeria bacterium]